MSKKKPTNAQLVLNEIVRVPRNQFHSSIVYTSLEGKLERNQIRSAIDYITKKGFVKRPRNHSPLLMKTKKCPTIEIKTGSSHCTDYLQTLVNSQNATIEELEQKLADRDNMNPFEFGEMIIKYIEELKEGASSFQKQKDTIVFLEAKLEDLKFTSNEKLKLKLARIKELESIVEHLNETITKLNQKLSLEGINKKSELKFSLGEVARFKKKNSK
jgi:hypothetical protein